STARHECIGKERSSRSRRGLLHGLHQPWGASRVDGIGRQQWRQMVGGSAEANDLRCQLRIFGGGNEISGWISRQAAQGWSGVEGAEPPRSRQQQEGNVGLPTQGCLGDCPDRCKARAARNQDPSLTLPRSEEGRPKGTL